jgi:hypothetical protein
MISKNITDIFREVMKNAPTKSETINEEKKELNGSDFLVSPAVACFCFDSIDFEFEKDETINEDIYSDVKNELKALRRGKTSEVSGTMYKLSKEQKRALKYLKKKYGRALVKEIKEYRKNTIAPYQVVKAYNDKSRSLFAKELFGMTKEEYLKYKKSAEAKILNMRSNKYNDLTKDLLYLNNREKNLNDLNSFVATSDISEPALNKVFKKYKIYSSKYSEQDMRAFQRAIENVEEIKKEVLDKLSKSTLNKDDIAKLKRAVSEVKTAKSSIHDDDDNDDTPSTSSLSALSSLAKKISSANISDKSKIDVVSGKLFLDLKGALTERTPIKNSATSGASREALHARGISPSKDLVKKEVNDAIWGLDNDSNSSSKITSKSFETEYENFLTREKIRDDVRNKRENKYTDDYNRNVIGFTTSFDSKRKDLVSKMAAERAKKTLTDNEKKIYELKVGKPSDSDNLSDYNLKIKETDFFEPKYYTKSEKFKEAERKVDAEIKRFERGMEAKMEPKDFQLLKKYRLISNLVTIKNAMFLEEEGNGEN